MRLGSSVFEVGEWVGEWAEPDSAQTTRSSQPERSGSSREAVLGALELDADDVNVRGVDVLEGVRWRGMAPDRSARLRQRMASLACVHQNRRVDVPAHEVAEREDVEDSRPTMRVDFRRLAGRDPGLQDSDGIVLEE